MQPIDIIILVAAVLAVGGAVALSIFRKKKGKRGGEWKRKNRRRFWGLFEYVFKKIFYFEEGTCIIYWVFANV